MKKLVVDENACISCGACVSIDKEHFAFNDNMVSHAISQENLDSNGVKTAIESCPTGAISIQDDSENTSSECDGCCENCQNEEGEVNEGI